MPGGLQGAVRAAGAITLGVEEEFVLLDPSTGATVLAGPPNWCGCSAGSLAYSKS